MEAVVDAKYRPAFFLNGGAGAALAAAASSKKMRPTAAASAAWGAGEAGTYRECLKNHAASMGGFALDGCGEFMPAPESDPTDPASLRCAACGCHRNFHRRLLDAPPSPPLLALPPPPAPPAPPVLQPAAPPASAPPPTPPPQVVREIDGRAPLRGEETPEDRRLPAAFDEETDEESDEGSDFDDEEDRPVSPLPAPAMAGLPPPLPGYLQPASHMHLALSTGASAPAVAPRPSGSLGIPTMPPPSASAAAAAASAARKRFRSKFSPEQKQLMRALSERLGWRLQKRDEAVVEDTCREIGVTKAVFKVWMHNNKHNFVAGHSARRSATAASASAAATGGAAPILPPPHAAAVHPSVHAAPAPHPQPAAPVHAYFNINGTTSAADYFRIQPAAATAAASGSSPQSC
ncbi:unnamed protein product [Urochloa humidicola]